MRFDRLSPALGVEVHDLDLGAPDELRRALLDHHLLLVRGRELTDDEHLAFARVFGPIASEGSGQVGIVSNVRPDGVLGSDRATWHSDYMFFPRPYEAISLYGLDIPPAGTQTGFANGVLAARTLPPELRARLVGLRSRAVAALGESLTDGIRYTTGRCDGVDPHRLRPVLWPHHATGEEIVAAWHQQTDALLPLPQDESVALLDELFAHLYRPEHTYVHDWQPHDLVLWDNHALQHSRPEVGVEQPRSLRRVCVGEDQDLTVFARRHR
jgi:alpha-ketoglutarate-dependent taurine dioxygenase